MKTFTREDAVTNFCDGVVTIPRGYLLVREDAFSDGENIREVHFLSSVDFNYKIISQGLFKDCPQLKKVVFRFLPSFSPTCIFKHCPSEKVDLYLPHESVEEVQKDFLITRIFNSEIYKTKISFHSNLELKNSDTGK